MTTRSMKIPVLSNEGGLGLYLEQIKKFPMLDAEEEYMLAKNWKTKGNIKMGVSSDPKLSNSYMFLRSRKKIESRKK